MRLARVIGQVVSTAKSPSLDGFKLLVLADLSAEGDEQVDPGAVSEHCYVGLDLVGAGVGEVVLVATGSAARSHERTRDTPTDRAVVAIADSVTINGTETYHK